MRSLTQVRRLQLQNGWTVTALNELEIGVEYAPSHVHDNHPFVSTAAPSARFMAKELAAAPPSDQRLTIATTMWRHTPMYHVVIADGIAACGRDELKPSSPTLSDIPADSVCPICRPHTGIPYPARPERQWISIPGFPLMHIAAGERSTACALWCSADDYERVGPLATTADSDLGNDVPRCEVCVRNQDANDLCDSWRYL